MQLLFGISLTLVWLAEPDCRSIPDTIRTYFIGQFSDMQYTEEHAYGHTVELWRSGACIFGTLEVSDGLAGDVPIGLLREVRYDHPARGDLAFSARLITGMTMAPNSKELVPAHDIFGFTGHLSTERLVGKIIRSNQENPGSPSTARNLLLIRIGNGGHLAGDARSYGEWRAKIEPILRFRGPER